MSETDYAIRLARFEELPALREIERAAGKIFAEIGLENVASATPLLLDFLQAQQRAGLVWVLTDADDQPVGFAAASELDGELYLEEIDVHPAHGRRGLGRRLLETVCAWAEEQGYPAVTLSTFGDVPWNAPFYSRLGFRIVEGGEIGTGLQALLEHSARIWFPLVRVCMRRDLQNNARRGD